MSGPDPSATEKISSVGILPWLRIGESIPVGDVVFYPGAEAIKLLGGRGIVLADRLLTYRETSTDEPAGVTVAIHALQLTNGGDAPHHSLRQATDILLIAAMFENDGGFGADANATTFTLIHQRLGGELGFVASRSRRRYGGFVSGSTTDIRVSRPHYCGSFSDFDGGLLAALVAASTHSNCGRLFDGLAWFRRSSTDADEVDEEVDLVLMLTAVDFLLALPKTHGAGLDQERVEQLLKPFETLVCDRVERDKKLENRSHIQCVLYVLNSVRNATVHPRKQPRAAPYRFEQVQKIAFPWIADRCFMALLIARLVELGVLDKSSFVRAFVAGLERWISTLSDQSDSLGKLMYDVKLEYELQRVSAGVDDFDPGTC